MLNKKGMTLMEMMVVVIVIALLIAMAYPTFVSGLEKARAQEAIQVVSHLAAAQERFRGECYSMDSSGNCNFSTNFTKLPVEITGPNKSSNITVASDRITTTTFVYTFTGSGNTLTILATPRNEAYKYTISAGMLDSAIVCNTNGTDSGQKICSAIGKKTANSSVFLI